MATPSGTDAAPETGLVWSVKVEDVGPDGLQLQRSATAAERAALARALDIAMVGALHAELQLRASGSSGRYRLTGRIEADVTQSCVVTLEPVLSHVSEEVAVALWPAEEIGPMAEGEHSVLEADIPEPIEHGRIDLGRLVFEHLAAGLDPYPRRPDAAFDGLVQGPRGAGDAPASPFAALAALKQRGGSDTQ